MKKSLLASVFTVLLLMLILSCCGDGRPRYRIGVSQCSQDDWRVKVNDEINREMIFHDNAEVEIRSARDNNAKQIADIRYFIDNNFDAIIVSPNEAGAITPIIEEAYSKGIPVVVFDRDINSERYTAKVAVDNEGIGREAAHYGRSIIEGEFNVLEFQGLKGSSPTSARHKGFVEAIAGMPDSRIVSSHFADWYELDAEKATDSLLKVHPEVNLIFAHNDRMAIGAARSARRQGRRDIKILGVDAAPNLGIKAVADSVIDATFLYPTEGHLLVQTAMNILENKPYDAKVLIPALPAVDRSNAAIMLRQDKILRSETDKLLMMNNKANTYSSKYSMQTAILIISILLLFAFVFVMLRSARMQKRSRRMLAGQNEELKQQRDKQRDLYRQLDEAMQSKLVFFTNVSHDLRTPLTLIAEPIRALEKSTHISQQERNMLKIADRNIDILHRLINQILDFRKFESGKLDFNPAEVDPCALLQHWLESFRAVALRRNIKLTLDCDMHPQVQTMAVDADKIERVVYNLVSNALRHTADGGKIEIKVSSDSRYLRISVSDNGEGIDPDKLPLIFEQFYQAGDHGSGSGIGLSLTKAFVELHDGEISVESALGRGSCFTVTLPVLHVDPLPKATDGAEPVSRLSETDKAAAAPADDKPLLLAIDDNEDIRTLLVHLLGDDYNIISAVDGKDGLEKARQYVPDLILCDVMMPVMDGLECCRQLKKDVSTSHIPVLLLTARSLDEQRVEGYDSGADAYIAKPFGAELLKSRCRNLLLNRKRIKNIYAFDSSGLAVADETKTRMPLATSDGVRTDIDNEFYRKFIGVVGQRLADAKLSVEAVAGEIGLSQSQLTRKIKALTGLTPVELIRNLRLAMARRMLRQTDKPVSEVAAACGFTSHAYFSKCYRDAYGASPTDGRKA